MAAGAFAQDLLTRIINVHWAGGGLAVEFGDKAQDAPGMGARNSKTLRTNELPNLAKGHPKLFQGGDLTLVQDA